MSKVLYISDLDGTLLRNDQTLSFFTVDTIRKLTENGLLFSYATARSYATASKVTKGLPANLPVITFNGTFIVETGSGRLLHSVFFDPSETKHILNEILRCGVYPIVNAFIDGKERFSYFAGKETKGVEMFLQARQNDARKRSVNVPEDLFLGDVFHIACIDEAETLRPLYERFKDCYPCVFYRDMYTGEMWFEIHPIGATKATAAMVLKHLLGCDEVVCFGDGVNDIPLFRMADRGYAVENADASLKKIASDIIESNEMDGVARWLVGHNGSENGE